MSFVPRGQRLSFPSVAGRMLRAGPSCSTRGTVQLWGGVSLAHGVSSRRADALQPVVESPDVARFSVSSHQHGSVSEEVSACAQ